MKGKLVIKFIQLFLSISLCVSFKCKRIQVETAIIYYTSRNKAFKLFNSPSLLLIQVSRQIKEELKKTQKNNYSKFSASTRVAKAFTKK